MTYSAIDWACDQIRAYEATHNCRPDSLLLTVGQARAILDSAPWMLNGRHSYDERLQDIRNGKATLMGVPLKLFEVKT